MFHKSITQYIALYQKGCPKCVTDASLRKLHCTPQKNCPTSVTTSSLRAKYCTRKTLFYMFNSSITPCTALVDHFS